MSDASNDTTSQLKPYLFTDSRGFMAMVSAVDGWPDAEVFVTRRDLNGCVHRIEASSLTEAIHKFGVEVPA